MFLICKAKIVMSMTYLMEFKKIKLPKEDILYNLQNSI